MSAPLVVLAAEAADASVGGPELLASLVLVAVAVALSSWRGLGLERSIVWAAARAAAQLLVVGTALVLVVADDAPVAWAWLWVVAMVPFAALTIERRAPEVPGLRRVAAVAIGAAATVSLGVVFGLGLLPVEGRTVVPVAGMMIGNSMKDAVVAARRTVAELAEHRPEVEARLALGHPWPDAARRFTREAARTALISQVETTKAVGLVFLPGAMTGLILAGVDPVDAVLVQLALMYLILGSVATVVVVTTAGVSRRLFTSDHRLLPLERRS